MKIFSLMSIAVLALLDQDQLQVSAIKIKDNSNSKKLLAAATAINKIQKSQEKADENEALKEVRKIIRRRDKK